MKHTEYLANRLQEVLLDGKWISNTNLKEQIQKLDWKIAVRKKDEMNSIAMLVFHLNYYLEGILCFYETGKLEISDKYSFDMPEIKNEEDWKKLGALVIANAEAMVAAIRNLKDEKMEEVFVKEEYGTYLRNIDGLIEHCYYHLGQVVIIGKMI